jgi:hypothetical protein
MNPVKDYEYIYIRCEIKPEELEQDTYGLFGDTAQKAVASPANSGSFQHCRLVAQNDQRALEIGRTLVDPVSDNVDIYKEIAIKI